MKSVIALCDANSFYCSCEQVFDPTLIGKPLGVLSNNDGCIVARTRELKAIGIAMGTPALKVREQVERGEIILKSSNYTLYGDMSSRFMSVLEHFSPKLEVYSIDEAFVDLSGFPLQQLERIGTEMKERVHRWTGLPIGVGISTTKTLTKLANYAAKRYPTTGGVVDLTSHHVNNGLWILRRWVKFGESVVVLVQDWKPRGFTRPRSWQPPIGDG